MAAVVYANRGVAFEQVVEYSNAMYERAGVAVINKRPTPVRVTSFNKGRVWGYFEKPSTVDFDGFLSDGRAIVFEAKESKEIDHFPLKNIQDHQAEYLIKAHEKNVISFVLIHMSQQRKVYLLTAESLKSFWERKKTRKRGSARITLEELDLYAHEVPSGRVPVDYLSIVEKLWQCESS